MFTRDETLYHIPSSCTVIAMHVVKGRQHSVHINYYFDAPIVETESETRPTLDLESDKSQCFNHRDELDSAVQLPKFRSVGLWTACYD
jgi:hypothetical protein